MDFWQTQRKIRKITAIVFPGTRGRGGWNSGLLHNFPPAREEEGDRTWDKDEEKPFPKGHKLN